MSSTICLTILYNLSSEANSYSPMLRWHCIRVSSWWPSECWPSFGNLTERGQFVWINCQRTNKLNKLFM